MLLHVMESRVEGIFHLDLQAASRHRSNTFSYDNSAGFNRPSIYHLFRGKPDSSILMLATSYRRANLARGKMPKDFREHASRQQGQGGTCGGEQVCTDLPSCP